MGMEGNCWATACRNGRGLFGQSLEQPLMEMEGNCLGNRLSNRLWKWKVTFGQPFM